MVPVSFKKVKHSVQRKDRAGYTGQFVSAHLEKPSCGQEPWEAVDKFGHVLWASEVQTKENNLCKDTFLPNEWCTDFPFQPEIGEKSTSFSGRQGNREKIKVTKMKDVSVASLAALM